MNDQQIEAILYSIKENDARTNELSDALVDFNKSFEKLIENLNTTLDIKGLSANITQIDKKLMGMQMQQINQGHPVLSDTAIFYEGVMFVINTDRKSLEGYDLTNQGCYRAYEIERPLEIKKVFVYNNQVCVLNSDGKLVAISGEVLAPSNIQGIKVLPYGLVLLDGDLQLMMYSEANGIVLISKGVIGFEVVSNRYIVYHTVLQQENGVVNETFICDLQDNNASCYNLTNV